MENFEARARAQCRTDLLALGIGGEEIELMIDHYWPAVAVELAGGIDVPGVRFPPDIADLVEQYEALRRRPGMLLP